MIYNERNMPGFGDEATWPKTFNSPWDPRLDADDIIIQPNRKEDESTNFERRWYSTTMD